MRKDYVQEDLGTKKRCLSRGENEGVSIVLLFLRLTNGSGRCKWISLLEGEMHQSSRKWLARRHFNGRLFSRGTDRTFF